MDRTLNLLVTLTITDSAVPIDVADAVLEHLAAYRGDEYECVDAVELAEAPTPVD